MLCGLLAAGVIFVIRGFLMKLCRIVLLMQAGRAIRAVEFMALAGDSEQENERQQQENRFHGGASIVTRSRKANAMWGFSVAGLHNAWSDRSALQNWPPFRAENSAITRNWGIHPAGIVTAKGGGPTKHQPPYE